MEWGGVITKAAAGVGAVLGVVNTWYGWRQRRVHLWVVPSSVEVRNGVGQSASGAVMFQQFRSPGITVANLSAFPVTIEVGYAFKDGSRYALIRVDGPGHRSSDVPIHIPDKLPQRLESHASLRMAWHKIDETSLGSKQIRHVYARTACGTTIRSSGGNLRSLSKLLTSGKPVVELLDKTS